MVRSDRVSEELWAQVCDIVQETVIKTIPRKRKPKRQSGCLRRPYKSLRIEEKLKSGEKERYTHLNAEFQRIARRDKKALLSNQCKEIGKTIEWERLDIYSRKLEIPREHFMQRWVDKGQKWYGPNRSSRY